ncbi:hypothetical protein INT46_003550 [Mucor plumbeus]|uniref:Uncharacterized protein n=1 Tax=Mucor plumbeus TaxID=97098 RepID=A0A8H7QW34_9FUNG|nr:hypothetical protein INT46_003550 [Mucor plumbeus]
MVFSSELLNTISSPDRPHKTDGFFKVIGKELPHIRLYTPEECKPLGGLIFNSITQYASSLVVFAITLTLLVVWAIVGAILGAPENWETIMQKSSSIRYYISDSIATVGRVLGNLQRHQGVDSQQINNIIIKGNIGDAAKMPSKNSFDRVCNYTSVAVESMVSLIIYWAGIFSWASFAVIELELIFHEQADDNKPNPIICIDPPKVSRAIRAANYYGDVVCTGVGTGDMIEWDSSWWLLIGTYNFLVGYVNGFVLRNVYFRHDEMLGEQFDILIENDERFSWMSRVCAMPFGIFFSVLVVLALISIASAMK